MKRKALAIVLTLVMLVGVLPMGAFAAETDTQVPAEEEAQAASYVDTVGHWAEKSIERWTAEKVLEGKGNDIFDPDGLLTRAESMTIFSRLLKLTEKADISKLTDVHEDDWFYPYVETGYVYEITNGVSETEFNPQGNITREQFFTMFARAVGIPPAAQCDKTFSDLDQTSSWAQGSVYAMINRGILNGYPDGSLRPLNYITRAEVAKVLDNAIGLYITESGTYDLSNVTGMVIVLADNVKLTGTYDGHIVSSCPNSTLDLNGLKGKPTIHVLQDNTKIINAPVGTHVSIGPAAENVTVNGKNVKHVENPVTNPYIVPAPGGSGGGGGGHTPTVPDKYKVTATVTVPFGGTPMQLTGGTYSSDQKLSTILNKLAGDTKGVENALQNGFDKITKTKTTTVDSYVITVTPNKSGDDVSTFTVTMTDAGAPVNMKQIVTDELALYQAKMDEKGAAAQLTGNAGWVALKGMFTADKLFTFSDDFTMTTKTSSQYAAIFADVLKNLAAVYDSLTADYQYKTNITNAVGSHWDTYNIFGNGLSQIDAILGGQGVMLQKTLDKNNGILIEVKENVNTADEFTAAVDRLSGRNYVSSPEIQALIASAFKLGDDGKTKYNVAGEYSMLVEVTDLSK